MKLFRVSIIIVGLLSGLCMNPVLGINDTTGTLVLKGEEARKAYRVWNKAFEDTTPDNHEMRDVLATIYYFMPARTISERAEKDKLAEKFKNKFGPDIDIREVGLPNDLKGYKPVAEVMLTLIVSKTKDLLSNTEELQGAQQEDPNARAIIERTYSFLLYALLGYDYPGVDQDLIEEGQKSMAAMEEIMGPERVIAIRKKVGETIQSPENLMQTWYELMSKPVADEHWCIPVIDYCLGDPTTFFKWDAFVTIGITVLAGTVLLFRNYLAVKKAVHVGNAAQLLPAAPAVPAAPIVPRGWTRG